MHAPRNLSLEHIEDCLKLGLLSCVNAHSERTEDSRAQFADVKTTSGLLPEILVAMIEELRESGQLTFERNERGNPYGFLSVTPQGQSLLSNLGPEAHEILSRAPEQYKASESSGRPRIISRGEPADQASLNE